MREAIKEKRDLTGCFCMARLYMETDFILPAQRPVLRQFLSNSALYAPPRQIAHHDRSPLCTTDRSQNDPF